MSLDIARADSERVCYILLPDGLREDGLKWLEPASAVHGVTLVAMSGMDWNDTLTPWSADGVFKKAKPFGGHADIFLKDLREDFFPSIEASLGLKKPERYLTGVSLSGLFAVWCCFKSDFIQGAASISGSLWYDGFAEWAESQSLSPAIRRIFLSLGDREKRSRDSRMSTVEDATMKVVESLRSKGGDVKFILEENTTHFSPLIPRLDLALAGLFPDNDKSI